jgi:hypothetical protein
VNHAATLTGDRLRPLAVWLLLIGCLPLMGGKQPEEYLDEETAATVTVVGEPLVFANPRRDLAANARDYVTMAAAAVDRAGKVSYVLITYIWSTVDPALRQDALPAPAALIVQADDRRIEFHLDGHTAHESGIGRPVHAPPASAAVPNVYHTDLATLRFLAEARHLKVLPPNDSPLPAYELWDDQRTALRAFVRRMGGD